MSVGGNEAEVPEARIEVRFLEEFIGIIDAILATDKDRPKKQRHALSA